MGEAKNKYDNRVLPVRESVGLIIQNVAMAGDPRTEDGAEQCADFIEALKEGFAKVEQEGFLGMLTAISREDRHGAIGFEKQWRTAKALGENLDDSKFLEAVVELRNEQDKQAADMAKRRAEAAEKQTAALKAAADPLKRLKEEGNSLGSDKTNPSEIDSDISEQR
jgi:hypothetical protein